MKSLLVAILMMASTAIGQSPSAGVSHRSVYWPNAQGGAAWKVLSGGLYQQAEGDTAFTADTSWSCIGLDKGGHTGVRPVLGIGICVVQDVTNAADGMRLDFRGKMGDGQYYQLIETSNVSSDSSLTLPGRDGAFCFPELPVNALLDTLCMRPDVAAGSLTGDSTIIRHMRGAPR